MAAPAFADTGHAPSNINIRGQLQPERPMSALPSGAVCMVRRELSIAVKTFRCCAAVDAMQQQRSGAAAKVPAIHQPFIDINSKCRRT